MKATPAPTTTQAQTPANLSPPTKPAIPPPTKPAIPPPTKPDEAETMDDLQRAESWLKNLNLLLCLPYLVMSLGTAVIAHQGYWRGGKILLEHFRPDLRLPSPLLPVWYHIPDQLPFGGWLNRMYAAAVALCMVWMSDFVTGFELALAGNRKDCLVFASLLIITLIAQTTVLLQMNDMSKSFHQDAITVALEEVQRDYQVVGINAVTAAFNMMMVQGQCCGFEGPQDFASNTLSVELRAGVSPYKRIVTSADSPAWLRQFSLPVVITNFSSTLGLPPACCSEEIFNEQDSTEQFRSIILCSTQEDVTKLNVRGCYTHIFDEHVAAWGMVVAVVMVYAVELLLIFFLRLVILDEPSWSRQPPLSAALPVKPLLSPHQQKGDTNSSKRMLV